MLYILILLLIWNVSQPVSSFTSTTRVCACSKYQKRHAPQSLSKLLPLGVAKTDICWYPDKELDDGSRRDLEEKSLELATELVRQILPRYTDSDEIKSEKEDVKIEISYEDRVNEEAYELARGRFVDFCGDRKGEKKLESLFLRVGDTEIVKSIFAEQKNEGFISYRQLVEGAIFSLQSLLALGITYGLTMNPIVVSRNVEHMKEDIEHIDLTDTIRGGDWTPYHTLRLKYQVMSNTNGDEKLPGLQLLSVLKFKQSPVGAYNLLVQLGVWERHENLALLRSGFPLRFTTNEEAVASHVATESSNDKGDDPDEILGIRRDFRSQKIYTIDSASTKEIDDGLGVEIIDANSENDQKRHRYWIHIADADRWAPRNSELFAIARRRATSIYLPGKSIPMIPSSVSQQVMSLKAQTDAYALSLGVELDDDGSIIDDSIIVTPSIVRVDYRLTYDEADEMLEDGVAYNEEWELGKLFDAAQQRRKFRMNNGSSEDFIPTQIPKYTISTFHDLSAPDHIGIEVDVHVSHNGGKNQSSIVADSIIGGKEASSLSDELPVSSASTLVTELMILAGEAIGKWAISETKTPDDGEMLNSLKLPFRCQDKPDYRSRERERKIMMDLLEHNIGDGYCHAWYSRRFLSPARISSDASPHSGLGLECYVQWTSPIRRFQDLQVHAAVKRFIRRQRIIDLFNNGQQVPDGICLEELGCDPASLNKDVPSTDDIDNDIDYSDRTKLLRPAQFVMRNSNKFWILEYIRRIKDSDPQREFQVLVLGCINPAKRQYAVFVYEFGLEWRYSSPVGIQAGDVFKVRIGNVLPQNGQLTFFRVAKS